MLSKQTLDNLDSYAKHYSKKGWVRISNFLSVECAEQFAASVYEVADVPPLWQIATLVQGKPFVAQVKDYLAQEPYVRSHFIAEILRFAQQNDFQYFYEFIHLLDDGLNVPPALNNIAELWRSDVLLNALKQVSAEDSVGQLDAQLTRYKPGHFLKHHSDEGYQAPQQRKVAYVLSLSKNWQADWGGLLHLQEGKEVITQSLIPEFNSITLFKVPTAHFVSQVTNYCPASRYSLTGWLWAK